MSEQEMNSYRFTSGEEPSEEMLDQIMREVTAEAMRRRRDVTEQMEELMRKRRKMLRKEWENKLKTGL